jgi:N-acetylglutamate synthase-like GNAT family acetyltransferase
MHLRPYTPEDHVACLAIFDSNTPDYFAASERSEFASFLDDYTSPYFVVTEQPDTVIACGGFFRIPQAPVAILTWGMVSRSRQRQGIGSFLLWQRLRQLSKDPSITGVKLQTSQHTYGFFEQAGFTIEQITEHGFGAGLHQYNMQLELDAKCRERIAQECAKLT